MSDNNVFEFGFDEGTVIKNQAIDRFKQNRSGQKDRISIVSFKRVHDGVLASKAREKGSPLTDAEKAAKQQAVKDAFNAREQAENWSAWTLDEATCTMVPPIPRPEPDQAKMDQGIFTFWCGAENNWKDTPARPTDGGQYKFDFLAWQWVVVSAQ